LGDLENDCSLKKVSFEEQAEKRLAKLGEFDARLEAFKREGVCNVPDVRDDTTTFNDTPNNRGSLLDDFADPVEFPMDYIGGDD
jgi:hypothetical protein